jgi:hypothetical protein
MQIFAKILRAALWEARKVLGRAKGKRAIQRQPEPNGYRRSQTMANQLGMNPSGVNLGAVQSSALNVVVQKP